MAAMTEKSGGKYVFWRPLGRLLGPSWDPLGGAWGRLGSRNGRKFEKKSMQKSIRFLMPLEIVFLEDFGRSWAPKWSQVGAKIGPKIAINCEERIFKKSEFSLGKNDNRGVSGGLSWQPKSTKRRSKFEVQDRLPFDIDFA